MKKLHLIYFLFFCFFTVNGQNSNDIIIGEIDSINSKVLNEQRKIWVYTPKDNSDGTFAKKTYPVVYLLDGSSHFLSVVGMIQNLSYGNTIVPKMIVVGIPNTNRTRDLTPNKGTPSPIVNESMISQSGGGENFMSFIEKELIPYIDSNYPTQLYRTLIGHSLGGLTVMNTVINHPNLFDSYVAIDPSMWWADKKLLNKIKQKQFDEKYKNKKLFLGIANTMSDDMDISRVQKDSTIKTQHIRSILELNTILNENTQKNLSFKGKYYDDDDHGSVPLITTYDAFRFIFDWHRLKVYYPEDYGNPESKFLDKIVKHYKKLSKGFGMEMKPDEELINSYGYQFMNMKQLKKSEQFFKLNVTNYPESFNVYDSLGDYYVKIGDKKRAIINFRKAISLNSKSEESIKKLNELEKE